MFTLAGIAAVVAALVAASGSPVNAPAHADAREHLVSGVTSALGEATCTAPWSELDDCKPVWPASRAAELAALVVVTGRFESGLDPRIGRTQCRLRLGECDAEKLASGGRRAGALGYFQTKRFLYTSHELREVIGSSGEWSVYLQARTAIRALAGASNACGGGRSLRAAISGYATGGSTLAGRCWWSGAKTREREVRRLLALASSSGEVNRKASPAEPPAVARRD